VFAAVYLAVLTPLGTCKAARMPDALAATRLQLHTLAEHVLAPDLYQAIGKIGLRQTPGGFGQPEQILDGTRRGLRIDGGSLVVTEGDHETWHPLTTLGDAAKLVGLPDGAETGAYAPSTLGDPGIDVRLDSAAAASIAAWFELVDHALEELRRRHADLRPTIVQLWPEHFDLACAMAEANFGGSPGDAGRPEPYVYVGPWSPRDGDFWNEPYGAAKSRSEIGTIDAAVAFFEQGLAETSRG
jgi:hypothetical protein